MWTAGVGNCTRSGVGGGHRRIFFLYSRTFLQPIEEGHDLQEHSLERNVEIAELRKRNLIPTT